MVSGREGGRARIGPLRPRLRPAVMKRLLQISLAIGLASFCLSAAIDLWFFPATTLFPDESRFLASAVGLVETGTFWANNGRAWEMPGAALFYAVWIWLFGTPEAALFPIRLAQAVLVVLQAGCAGAMAAMIFRDRVTGLIAFAMTAFYPFLIFYSGTLYSETLFDTFLMAGFACLYWWRERGMRIDSALAATCVCFGLATLTKATLTLLPPLLVAAMTLGGRSFGLTARTFVIAALIYCGVLAPWWIRNYAVLGTFVPFTTSAAENLYLGNNPRNPHVGIDWRSDVDLDLVARLRAIPDELERQRAYGREATAYIAADPKAFAVRMRLKLLRFWNIVPNAAEYSGAAYRFISILSFGPVLLLAFAALLIWWRRFVDFAPIVLTIVYFTALHMVVIASLRYRLPLEPLLIVLASGPAGLLARWVGRRREPAAAAASPRR
jgi:hypothetical protein